MSDAARGRLFIVAAPSGAGKTSLVKALVDRVNGIEVSVSHTTRPARPGETDGEHYHFIDADTYKTMVEQDAFLEHAWVHGNGYGSSRRPVEQKLDAGLDVILEIDWQGARQARRWIPEALSVFILPPSLETLEQRLRGRGQDSDAVIRKRLDAALSEMTHYREFDYLVVNDRFENAVEDLITIVSASRLGTPRQAARYPDLLAAVDAS
ncbi:MAG: guanylate kinase [Xanthomonadales bacterium]|nr:guanylate kinase [Xanthomonadales bacterium]